MQIAINNQTQIINYDFLVVKINNIPLLKKDKKIKYAAPNQLLYYDHENDRNYEESRKIHTIGNPAYFHIVHFVEPNLYKGYKIFLQLYVVPEGMTSGGPGPFEEEFNFTIDYKNKEVYNEDLKLVYTVPEKTTRCSQCCRNIEILTKEGKPIRIKLSVNDTFYHTNYVVLNSTFFK